MQGSKEDLIREIPNCFVILFHKKLSNGRTEEGIYSMSVPSDDDPSAFIQIVLAFEDKSDCEGAASQLSDYTQFKPHCERIPTQDLLDFAMEAGYEVQLEPRGSTFMAPDATFGSQNGSGKTDWEKSIDIREKGIQVHVVDPEEEGGSIASAKEQEELRRQLNKLWESS